MGYPRHQYVLCVIRGRRTRFFYGLKLGDLVKEHVKIGDSFGYATLTTSRWRDGRRSGKHTYSTEG